MSAIDEKSKLFVDRLDAYTQNVKVLTGSMEAQLKEVTESIQRQRELAQSLRTMAQQEPFDALGRALDRLAELFELLARQREHTVVGRMQSKVKLRLNATQKECIRPTKVMLTNRSKQLLALGKAREAVRKLEAKGTGGPKLEKAKAKLVDEATRSKSTDEEVTENMVRFEEQRLLETRDTMLEFLREQMFQYCRALEQMTEMHEALAGLGMDGHVHAFARKLSGYPLSGIEELHVMGAGDR